MRGWPPALLTEPFLEPVDFSEEASQAILQFNAIVAGLAQTCGAAGVADVFSAFLGRQRLLIIDRKHHEPFEVHPTNAGYRVIADAFEAVH